MQLCDLLNSFCAETDLKEKKLLIIQSFSLKMSYLIIYFLLSFHELNSVLYIFIYNLYSILFNESCVVKFTSFKICLIFLYNFNFYYDSVMLYNIILMLVSLL